MTALSMAKNAYYALQSGNGRQAMYYLGGVLRWVNTNAKLNHYLLKEKMWSVCRNAMRFIRMGNNYVAFRNVGYLISLINSAYRQYGTKKYTNYNN